MGIANEGDTALLSAVGDSGWSRWLHPERDEVGDDWEVLSLDAGELLLDPWCGQVDDRGRTRNASAGAK